MSSFILLIAFLGLPVPGSWIDGPTATSSAPRATEPKPQGSATTPPKGTAATPPKATETRPQATEPDRPLSDAERLTQTQRLLDQALKEIESINQELKDPESEYAKAERDFKTLDEKLTAQRRELEKLKEEGKTDEAAKVEADLANLTVEWTEARDRFNRSIAQRKITQEKQSALQEQVKRYEQRISELRGEKPATPAEPPPVTPTPAATVPPVAPTPTAPPPEAPAATSADAAPAATTATPAPVRPTQADAEAEQAKAVKTARRAALQEAEERARSVEEKVRNLIRLIQTEERLLAMEREAANQTQETLHRQADQIQDAPADTRRDLIRRMSETQRRLAAHRERIGTITERLSALNEELRTLQQEEIEALRLIEQKQREAAAAEEALASLLDPLSRRNINRWLASHGINCILIVAGILFLYLLNRLFSRQFAWLIARNSHRGSEEDRENRAKTLVGVYRHTANLVIFSGGTVILLDELGVPVMPLLGGAAVLGLAVAFGAQNLIKDYFTGFMMLLEDQYGVNDVVRIGGTAGQVERITLRVTILRDLEGVVHFIPHGSVTSVSNMTHGWSRALFDVPVPHSADLNRVMDSLIQLGKELRNEPAFRLRILDDPELLGVNDLDGTAAVVRFLIKTRPLQQWAVRRELLKRIKLRFDALGIAIPAPMRNIRVTFPDGASQFEHARSYPAA
ncbi:MAG TPA: mechanosensitive ion channel [Gemmatales bacterium]|nr:mechanosensitive ion channel [Gemmatales bacterium]